MLINDESFRNLAYNYIIIKSEEAAQNIAKTYEVVKIMEEEGDFTGTLDDIEANEYANGLLVIPYIDHDAGFSFGIIEVLHIDENNRFEIIKPDECVEKAGLVNVRRKEGLEDAEFIYLEESPSSEDLDLKKYSDKEKAYVTGYTDDDLMLLRSIKELDPFRNDLFPDDIEVLFILRKGIESDETIMEKMWVRANKYEKGLIYGTLLNTPYDERFNLKVGDEVRFGYDDDPRPICLAVPMKDRW